ncbi:MAG: hypothetical protein AAB917_01960 [Patescibacteria group bacterium]
MTTVRDREAIGRESLNCLRVLSLLSQYPLPSEVARRLLEERKYERSVCIRPTVTQIRFGNIVRARTV